jgi:hypothetical protein
MPSLPLRRRPIDVRLAAPLAMLALLPGSRAHAETDILAFCRPLPPGCACSYGGFETIAGPEEIAGLLLGLRRAGWLTPGELAAFARSRHAACPAAPPAPAPLHRLSLPRGREADAP